MIQKSAQRKRGHTFVGVVRIYSNGGDVEYPSELIYDLCSQRDNLQRHTNVIHIYIYISSQCTYSATKLIRKKYVRRTHTVIIIITQVHNRIFYCFSLFENET